MESRKVFVEFARDGSAADAVPAQAILAGGG